MHATLLAASLGLAIAAGAMAPSFATAAAPSGYAVTPYQPAAFDARSVDINKRAEIAGMSLSGPAAFLSAGQHHVDIGALLGSFRPAGLNNFNQVVGTAEVGDRYRPRAYLYDNGQMRDLGTLGGPSSVASAINDQGQIVGHSSVNDWDYRAFVYQDGTMRELGTPGAAGSVSAAFDINSRGQVVGEYVDANQNTRAFLYENGVVTDLGTLGGGYASATDISEDGRILGLSRTADGISHNFIYHAGVMSVLPMTGFFEMRTSGINSMGDAVGSVPGQNPSGAYLWSGGEMHDIASLVEPGWHIYDAVAINDLGQIAAAGCLADSCSAVMLTPVPEPGLAAMLLAGLGLLGLIVRMRLHPRP